MTDQLLKKLRAADPARNMPPTSSATREVIRARIREAELVGQRDRPLVTSPGFLTRRRLLVAVATMLVMVTSLGGWVYHSYFMDRETVAEEFRIAQLEMPLPIGAAWTTPNLPAGVTYGGKYGFIQAWHQSTNAWLREWMAAHEAGDHVREQTAVAAVERQVGLMPLSSPGDPEEVGGFHITAVEQMRSLVKKMKQGDLSAVVRFLELNP